MDFDDLLLLTEDLFRSFPQVRRAEAARFDQFLVDEYQDTNASQYRILQALAIGHRNLCVVGDDDQSIYGWRGPRSGTSCGFGDDWPDAKVVRLEENYRCTHEILKLANRLIRYNRLRHEKTLRAARPGGEKPKVLQFRDETEEAEQIVGDIARRLARGDCEPGDFAILFRTNEQPRLFETELRRGQIPYVLIGGMSFFDRKEVRDILAYLQSWSRPMTNPRCCELSTRRRAGSARRRSRRCLMKRSVAAAPSGMSWRRPTGWPASARPRPRRFTVSSGSYDAINGAASGSPWPPVPRIWCRKSATRAKSSGATGRMPDAVQARWQTVEEVVNSLAEYASRSSRPTLRAFLDEIQLAGREQDSDKQQQLRRNAVVLLTLHSAKGLEFPQVYLVGLEEGLLPHRRSLEAEGDSIDEERRLCYVGITRAQERLTLSLALTRRKWGKPRPTHASRFLFEITGQADNPRNPARLPPGPPSKTRRQGTAASPRGRRR